jgi:lipoprotein-anchoring transpeptidase ErfK/SrfK
MKRLKGIIVKTLATVSVMIGLTAVPGYALAQKTFVFDPRQHKWFAYDNGELIKSGVASGGANYCPDTGRHCHTPVGVFSVRDKGGPGCKSTIYPIGRGGAPMPYCMHFTKFYAIHGSYEVVPGRNVSHGCIRIYPEAARWLSQNFITVGTRVIVKPY